jgi:hypothetical protein
MSITRRNWRGIARVIAVVVGFAALATVAAAWADSNPRVYSPNARPHGTTLTEWGEKWVQWAFSIPPDQSPFLDPDGRFCQVGQSGPVFFLGASFGGDIVRSCTVATGTPLLISPGGTICILHVDAETEEGLRACVEQQIDAVTNVVMDVDGIAVEGLSRYIIESPLFGFTLPADNVLGLQAGEYQAILGGYFVLVKPLPPGEHLIHDHADFPPQAGGVTYEITVVPRGSLR